jgi:hypothetical protein
MFRHRQFVRFAACAIISAASFAQSRTPSTLVEFDCSASPSDFPIAGNSQAAGIYVSPQSPETVRVAAQAFASDVSQVTGVQPSMLRSLDAPLPADLILVGVLGQSPEIDALVASHKLDASAVGGKWESAVTAVVAAPMPGVRRALVIAGSDRRGAAYALFTLSRQMGVSPWTWWADVPVQHHAAVCVRDGVQIQPEPSVQYRGIFLNDEDWGLRPWASKKMDPTVDGGKGSGDQAKGNIGPHTYERIFELLLRLHANSLWPAMHPGSLAFNAVPENAKLADKWGIVMGSSHSEALLRNNVGEWNEKTDGPWNYQVNAPAMNAYWDKRLAENGKYENFYTVGLRGVHDSGLEAKGTPEVKARLVEDVMAEQRAILAKHITTDLPKIPQVIWLYKESLDLYRVGMKVPPDVTLGWTDDNYGYIRELPDAAEQTRPGGSGVYYHVSYWGAPHDYLWLCTTPPALIREEMTKAYDHNARRYWILNVGDLKPAEMDIDYFLQLAWDEPGTAAMTQREFLTGWFSEQFPLAAPETTIGRSITASSTASSTASLSSVGSRIAGLMTRYYALNFIRKPEFMGFNGYNDGIKRTAFNPNAWGDQNRSRLDEWKRIEADRIAIAKALPPQYASAFFELVAYPVGAGAAMNDKFLLTDRGYLDASEHRLESSNAAVASSGYSSIAGLTSRYNALENGKWDGIMSDAPRERHVFEMPRTATAADVNTPLPASWGAGSVGCQRAADPASPWPDTARAPNFTERHCTVSIAAADFARKSDATLSHWNILPDLGISGASVVYGAPGLLANPGAPDLASEAWASAPFLEYDFATSTSGPATLAIHLLPTFPLDSDHRLRYGISLDHGTPIELDAASPATPMAAAAAGDGPANSGWADNVLRNDAIATIPFGPVASGRHTLTLFYRDPGVIFQHLVLTFPGAPPAYPVPPETR